MKLLFDFLPVLLFFITFKFYADFVDKDSQLGFIPGGTEGAIYAATLVAIIASAAQVLLFWLKHRRFEKMHLITLGLITVLGGATLLFQDETFIKWKPTAVNWMFAVAFLGSQFIGSKPLVQRMMEANIELDEPRVWTRLNVAWVVFFTLMGIVNIYVAYNYSTEFWVNFKLFGLLGLTLLFVIGQAFFLAKHIVAEDEDVDDTASDNTVDRKQDTL